MIQIMMGQGSWDGLLLFTELTGVLYRDQVSALAIAQERNSRSFQS